MGMSTKQLTKKVLSKTGQALLEVLGAFGDAAKAVNSVPYKRMRTKSDTSYYRGLRELKDNKLVLKRKRYKKIIYVLTEKGSRLLRKKHLPTKRHDGFSTIIIFDIPEEKSRQRTIFRRYLLRYGYTSLQTSVFISSYEISQEIKDLVQELNIAGYVNSFDGKMTFLMK